MFAVSGSSWCHFCLSAKIFVKIYVGKFGKAKRHPLRNVVYIFYISGVDQYSSFAQLILSISMS